MKLLRSRMSWSWLAGTALVVMSASGATAGTPRTAPCFSCCQHPTLLGSFQPGSYYGYFPTSWRMYAAECGLGAPPLVGPVEVSAFQTSPQTHPVPSAAGPTDRSLGIPAPLRSGTISPR